MTTNNSRLDRVLNNKQTAELLGATPGTIRAWDSKGIGPRSFKVNGLRRWRESVVLEWLAEQEAATGGDAA